MKKAVAAIVLILCLLVLSACGNDPYRYYKRRALGIETECPEYSLKLNGDVSSSDTFYEITDKNYVSADFLRDPANDELEYIEYYNEGGLYVYMSRRVVRIFDNGRFYGLSPQFFRDNSLPYNQIEQIWSDKYDGVAPQDVPNYIVGAAVFDGNVFVLAENDVIQAEFDREHSANLWKFDCETGKLTFCGFCVSDGELFNLRDGVSIVKTV